MDRKEGDFMTYSLEGQWQAELADGSRWQMTLPGTLDENQIGYRDKGANQWHPDVSLGNDGIFDPDAPIGTRFTRKYTYEGEARLTRTVSFAPPEGKRVFVEAERARCLRLLVNGQEVPDYIAPSISTPHVFEVTGLMKEETELTFLSDNSYPGLPHDAIVFSSAATDETQTNWNGILGYIRLRVEEPVFLQEIRVYPGSGTVDVALVISADRPYQGKVTICSEALARDCTLEVAVAEGCSEVWARGLALAADVRKWDEYEGNLYELSASLEGYAGRTVTFGVREFGDDGSGRFALNGRRIFIRSEANCAEFPETGHPPMTVEEWTEILKMFRSYGVNLMRFHSNTPPEAAFTAADRLGMMMEPELSHWNPRTAFEAEDAWAYYQTELRQIILTLANHPSFVMLTLGNELWTGELGLARMDQLIEMAQTLDGTRKYANGSNPFYGTAGCHQKSDFFTGMSYYGEILRGISPGNKENNGVIPGHINNQYPNARTNYEHQMAKLRYTYKKPVFGFEVGQFEVLPDFDELEDFRGISDPANYRLIQDKVRANGLEPVWKRYVEATGELSRIGYREEVEASMRTPSMSGLSLLGLQDFPGQGTALVGMLNSHLQPKPFDFAKPERFAEFFRAQLPLVLLEKYTYEATETLCAEVLVANYGKEAISGPVTYELKAVGQSGADGEEPQTCIVSAGAVSMADAASFPAGELTSAGILNIPLDNIRQPTRLDLTITAGPTANTYPVWVYPAVTVQCPETVYETETLDEHAAEVLKSGGRVYLSPKATKEALPSSVRTQFTTDFWSVGTFPYQTGTMGQLIDTEHPIFRQFPTEFHTNWQWWPMASQRAVILPRTIRAIVTEMDSYAYMRPMAQLFECRCGGGKLLFSSMGLQELQQYPEARALQAAIYQYMDSEQFAPEQEFSTEEIAGLVR